MISHHHKCIFIHIPKCAGQSIESAFLQDVGLNWRTRAPLLLRYNDVPEVGPPRLAHLRAVDYLRYKYLSEELFQSYFKFTVVRNPYSRAVSLYHYLNQSVSFSEFAKNILPYQLWYTTFWFVRPQTDFILDDRESIVVDKIGHVESLESDIEFIRHQTGLRSEIGHVNSKSKRRSKSLVRDKIKRLRSLSKAGGGESIRTALFGRIDCFEDWREYYDDDTARAIGRIYAKDFWLLGYSREIE
jgi:hypothetical protein